MSKDRETRYFDFIHLHEQRLNLIYRRWEDQIARQTAANHSGLDRKIESHRKAAIAGIAIAFSSILTWQFGSNRVAAWQNSRQLNTAKSSIATNSQKLDRIALELENAAYQGPLTCIVQNGDIYQLTAGELNHAALSNEPRAFMDYPDTISLIRHNIKTQKPDAYLRLNPGNNLLFGSILETDSTLESNTNTIDLNQDPAVLANQQESVESYIEVQENAIALHSELSQCFGDYGILGTIPSFPQFPYAD